MKAWRGRRSSLPPPFILSGNSMRQPSNLRVQVLLSVLFCLAVFLFWLLAYPQWLNFHEQNQLFLLTTDYFLRDIAVAGGLADYIGEFIVQFYYVPWIGALLVAVCFGGLQWLTWCAMGKGTPAWYPLSFIPSLLLLWHCGDVDVLLSYAVALVLSLSAAQTAGSRYSLADIAVIPLLYWMLGPATWVYVAVRIIRGHWTGLWKAAYLPALQIAAYAVVLEQYPFGSVMWGINYYRIPMQAPALQFIIPAVILIVVWAGRHCPVTGKGRQRAIPAVQTAGLAVLALVAVKAGYDRDVYTVIRQDYLVRNERWADIIREAEKYQVKTAFSSECVNLALAMTGQLAERMFSFYQSGEDALIMPRVRDNMSDLPTAEAFFRLGMVNSAKRYFFDIQQSVLNYKNSGRCTRRIVECDIVNGKYDLAAKHLRMLKSSLFYRDWAKDAETYLHHEDKINAHPVWGRMRKLRYKEDFLYNYNEIDKMLGLLFVNNPENRMALDYFMGEHLLKGNVQAFMQYMSWVQQYGGYSVMPSGYRDAVECIQQHGNKPGSAYGEYVKRMMKGEEKNGR